MLYLVSLVANWMVSKVSRPRGRTHHCSLDIIDLGLKCIEEKTVFATLANECDTVENQIGISHGHLAETQLWAVNFRSV